MFGTSSMSKFLLAFINASAKRNVVIPDRVALIGFVPPGFVQVSVVISRNGNTDFVELGMHQYRVGRTVSPGGGAEDTDAGDVQVGIARSHLLDQSYVIVKRPAQVVVGKIVEGARAANGAA